MFIYTATILFEDKEIASKEGNDLDALYAWMLSEAQLSTEHYSGVIRENETKKIVKKFHKCSVE